MKKEYRSIPYVVIIFVIIHAFLLFNTPLRAGELKFEIVYSQSVAEQALTGRALLIVSPYGSVEPRLQTGTGQAQGIPLWGKNFEAVMPEEPIIMDKRVFGFPYKEIDQIPAGDYYVQAVINIYTEFKRSDGHTLWLHNDQWEGQQWNISPGNLYSDVLKIKIGPEQPDVVRIKCDKVIPPVEVPQDTKWVKRIKFQSKILSEFWGQPIFLGATILLPKGYDEHPDVYYPVNYHQGHFSLHPPWHFKQPVPSKNEKGSQFYQNWISDDCPRMIIVTFQHPCPYYDDSYAVNSANVGPYGDAIMNELITYIEEHFRIIREPYARVLSGGSTGGWEALALQIYYPDFFGGTWASCPDPVDFRYYELINIYEDMNAYYRIFNNIKCERPEARDNDGQVRYTVRDAYYYEWAQGDRHRSGGQWAIWEAVYSPIGTDGYPQPLWNWKTGEIDSLVAEAWKKYDLRYYLETNWSTIGSKLAGKLHIYTGEMDTYYLNNAVVLLENFLKTTKNPYYEGTVEYENRAPHCWGPRGLPLLRLFEEHIIKNSPNREDNSAWRY